MEVAALSTEIAQTARRLETLQAAADALQNVVVDSVPETPAWRPGTPALGGSTTALRPRVSRLDKPNHQPLIAALAIMDGWTVLLQDVVAGRRPVSGTVIREILDEDSCPVTHRLRAYRAAALDARIAEAAAAHSAHHRSTAQVLVAIRDGRMDDARHLMEADDGRAGSVRRLRQALYAWADMLAESAQ